jgi:sec-independent protein translocase protein TatB
MFGLTFEKILLIGIVAVFLLGPEKLPHYAALLARLVRQMRDMANGAKDRIRDEMGPEFDDVEWRKLDPRQYDPRRIIREALLEETEAKSSESTDAAGESVDGVAEEPKPIIHNNNDRGARMDPIVVMTSILGEDAPDPLAGDSAQREQQQEKKSA